MTDADPRIAESHRPELECDVVMKGGITSGIVYPGALEALRHRYRFRNIGGTSAGAIAAVMAAAAEHGRKSGGFERLKEIPQWIRQGDNLFRLFQPSPRTRGLYRLATAWIGTPWLAATAKTAWVAMRHFLVATALGAALGVVVAYLGATQIEGSAGHLVAIGGLVLALLGAASAFVLAVVRRLRKALPIEKYGFCSGLGSSSSSSPALTEWLGDQIDYIAGISDRETPLTFGDLLAKNINLVMLTTNLSHGAPYSVPFNTRTFYYDPGELRELFPPRIVDWMEREENRPVPKDAEQAADWEARLPRRPLPETHKLPVVVGVRLSLSFPVLLSAVPLWAMDYAAKPPEMRKVWFSDGGICSNFPMHFFDGPLPRRPTFGFNLRPTKVLDSDAKRNVWVGSPRSGILPTRAAVEDVGSFLGAVFDTMQNWSDNMLLRYPGYRDRVAHILQSPNEGGLNLNMPPEVIARMAERGQLAGERLIEEFDWTNHKWTRYRTTMASLEAYGVAFGKGLQDESAPTYAELIARERNIPKTSYMTDWSMSMREFAKNITDAFARLVEEWQHDPDSFDTEDAPDPKAILRGSPDLEPRATVAQAEDSSSTQGL